MKKITLFFIAVLYSTIAIIAQETKKIDVDITTNKGNDNWYASPWVWIVGGAVFILLLVALTRGSRKSD